MFKIKIKIDPPQPKLQEALEEGLLKGMLDATDEIKKEIIRELEVARLPSDFLATSIERKPPRVRLLPSWKYAPVFLKRTPFYRTGKYLHQELERCPWTDLVSDRVRRSVRTIPRFKEIVDRLLSSGVLKQKIVEGLKESISQTLR